MTETPVIEPVPRRCSLPTHTADRLLKEEEEKKKTGTQKFMGSICGVVTGRKSRSEGEF